MIDHSLTAANAGNERKVSCVTTQLEPNVLKNPRETECGATLSAGRSFGSDLATSGANPRRK